MGVLPVPPTVRLPTLITVPFSRSCFSQPCAYSQTRTRTIAPYSTDSSQRSVRNRGDTFIARRRPDASQSPPRLDPSLRASHPPIGELPRSFFSYAPDRETIRSMRPRPLPDFPPKYQPPPTRRAPH